MKNTKDRIQRIKIDSAYGKKKHFNAADRKEKYHYRIGVPLTLINVITGTVLFYVLSENSLDLTKYIPITFAFFAAILSGFQTYFNYNEKVEGHRRIGNRYLALMKKCDRLVSYADDNIIDNNELIKRIEELSAENDSINKDAESYPISQCDYERAKSGIESGEEYYSEADLKI